jgi:broad specificity phosphatase PhoE
VENWIAGKHEAGCESWIDFTARVTAALDNLPQSARVAVFTSATPAGICVARCFGSADPGQILHLAGAALNTNITTLAWKAGAWRLQGFNQIPHLDEPALRTLR